MSYKNGVTTFDFDHKEFTKFLDLMSKETKSSLFYTDIFGRTADSIDREAQKGIAKISNDLSESYKKERLNPRELQFGYDMPYAGYNERGSRFDGSRVIKNRTPPGKKDWFTSVLKDETKWMNNIENQFFDKLNKI